LRILVYEHVVGGGFAGEHFPSNILSEGYAMLRGLISDFKAAGWEVTTFLDSRLRRFNPPLEADIVVPINTKDCVDENLKKTSENVDCVYVIAPESGGTLRNLVGEVEASGGKSLNCKVEGIEKASNKMEVYRAAERVGLRTPETVVADIHEDIKVIRRFARDLGYPLVFKPVDGVGSSGLSVLRDETQVVTAVEKVRRESEGEVFIIQKLVSGVASSVSLISTGGEALPLTLNGQIVRLAPPRSDSSYEGGFVPLDHELRSEAFEAARLIVEALGGLVGYVGVDMVLTDEEPVIVEVNPRLTTSYVGLREVVNFNPAQAVADAVLERRLPREPCTDGYALFRKVRVPKPPPRVLPEIYGLRGVFSPPFPVTGGRGSCALILSHSSDMNRAEDELQKSKRSLLSIIRGGGCAW